MSSLAFCFGLWFFGCFLFLSLYVTVIFIKDLNFSLFECLIEDNGSSSSSGIKEEMESNWVSEATN